MDVVDYLLKPFRFGRFLQAVNKAGKLLKTEDNKKDGEPISASTEQGADKQKDYILVKSDFKVYRIFYKDLLYIESMKEYVAYHTPDSRILSLGSLKKLELELPPNLFMRIHKSYIANINQIGALEGNMIHLGKKKLPLGTSYKEAVLERVF